MITFTNKPILLCLDSNAMTKLCDNTTVVVTQIITIQEVVCNLQSYEDYKTALIMIERFANSFKFFLDIPTDVQGSIEQFICAMKKAISEFEKTL